MGCGASKEEEEEPEDEDVLAIEQKIEDATQYWEKQIEPLRSELQNLKDAYQQQLAETTNKRMPQQLGGFGSSSRKPVDDASKKLDDMQREIYRLQCCMREEIADLRAEQRGVIMRKERVKAGEEPPAEVSALAASTPNRL